MLCTRLSRHVLSTSTRWKSTRQQGSENKDVHDNWIFEFSQTWEYSNEKQLTLAASRLKMSASTNVKEPEISMTEPKAVKVVTSRFGRTINLKLYASSAKCYGLSSSQESDEASSDKEKEEDVDVEVSGEESSSGDEGDDEDLSPKTTKSNPRKRAAANKSQQKPPAKKASITAGNASKPALAPVRQPSTSTARQQPAKSSFQRPKLMSPEY